jgi:hypothetical protein
MSRYSEFVKAHMAKHKMTWSCAVCEIKKENLYKKKAPEKKAKKRNVDTPNKNVEDDEMDMPLSELIKPKKKAKKIIVEDDEIPPGIRTGMGFSDGLPNNFGDMTSADKKVLPAPPVRIPSINTLGAMPIELSAMIQDFIRPTEKMMTERADGKRKKETHDIEYYADREAKNYREFKALKQGFQELTRDEWEYAKTKYKEVEKEFDRYDKIFRQHFEEMGRKLNVHVPRDVLKPTRDDMIGKRFVFRGRDSTKNDMEKDLKKWLSKTIMEAQRLKRNIKKF